MGLSDHTLNNTAALAAVSLGAVAIEKHFIKSRKKKGPDSSFSIEPGELKELKLSTTQCWKALGSGDFERSASENKNTVFRRSLYFVEDMKFERADAAEKRRIENEQKVMRCIMRMSNRTKSVAFTLLASNAIQMRNLKKT